MRYARLVDDVDGVFGVRELERNPECDVSGFIKAAKVGLRGFGGEEGVRKVELRATPFCTINIPATGARTFKR